jgi:hypothetical protein
MSSRISELVRKYGRTEREPEALSFQIDTPIPLLYLSDIFTRQTIEINTESRLCNIPPVSTDNQNPTAMRQYKPPPHAVWEKSDVLLHPFLTSAPDGGELSASRSGRFTPWKQAPVLTG